MNKTVCELVNQTQEGMKKWKYAKYKYGRRHTIAANANHLLILKP
jgi:hypothetical protein